MSFGSQCFGQIATNPNSQTVNIPGTLQLVDKPPSATPVEALDVAVHELHGGHEFRTTPDGDGNFTLAKVTPGRYFLNLGFPGRIRLFASGAVSLMPDDFIVTAGESGPLRIVVSLRTSDLSVDVIGVPENHPDVIALLSPDDPFLTLRQSSFLMSLKGHQTRFGSTPPGSTPPGSIQALHRRFRIPERYRLFSSGAKCVGTLRDRHSGPRGRRDEDRGALSDARARETSDCSSGAWHPLSAPSGGCVSAGCCITFLWKIGNPPDLPQGPECWRCFSHGRTLWSAV